MLGVGPARRPALGGGQARLAARHLQLVRRIGWTHRRGSRQTTSARVRRRRPRPAAADLEHCVLMAKRITMKMRPRSLVAAFAATIVLALAAGTAIASRSLSVSAGGRAISRRQWREKTDVPRRRRTAHKRHHPPWQPPCFLRQADWSANGSRHESHDRPLGDMQIRNRRRLRMENANAGLALHDRRLHRNATEHTLTENSNEPRQAPIRDRRALIRSRIQRVPIHR